MVGRVIDRAMASRAPLVAVAGAAFLVALKAVGALGDRLSRPWLGRHLTR